jgi:hypothetical protein
MTNIFTLPVTEFALQAENIVTVTDIMKFTFMLNLRNRTQEQLSLWNALTLSYKM